MRDGAVDLAAAVMAGLGKARRYRGVLVATFAVQLLLSLVPAALVFAVVAQKLAREPALARALDGDMDAAVDVLRAIPSAPLVAVMSIVLVSLIHVAASWFLTAGAIGVYRDQPEGAADTARSFGAHGARRVFGFARLGLLCAPVYAALAIWAGAAIAGVSDRMLEIVSRGELAAALVRGLAGPALLLWLVWTAVDHARVELVADPHVAAWRALVRGITRVVRRPVCALHTLLGHVAVAALAALYLAIAGFGFSLLGLFALRQLLGLGRHAVHLAILGGQVELAARITRRR